MLGRKPQTTGHTCPQEQTQIMLQVLVSRQLKRGLCTATGSGFLFEHTL